MPARGSKPAVGVRGAKHAGRSRRLEFRLAPVPPFRLELAAWAIRRRPENLVDRWDGESYERVLSLRGGAPIDVAVRQAGSGSRPFLEVQAIGSRALSRDAKPEITRVLERALGLRVDLRPFYRLAQRDRRLRGLTEKYEGVKPPRFPTAFEGLINGIACQQLSLAVGIQLLNRLAKLAGPRFETEGGQHYGFPQPADLARLRAAQFRARGFSRTKARAVLELSGKIVSGELNLETVENSANEAAVERLIALRGVGRWTAEYALLRGLGRLDVFPGDDVGARNGLAAWLGLRGPMNYNRVRCALRRWQPYAGMLYFLMLLEGLSAAGRLAERSTAKEELEKIESDV